jgi:exosome complex component RRP42
MKMEISNLTKKRIQEFLDKDKRFDTRGLQDFRDISIETGISKNAEGSARVKMGDTEVIAGVKIDVSEPYTDSEDEGVLITIVELLPLSSPKFESGPPRINAIELARIVDRGIRESGFIDFKKLCIKNGEKVFAIFLDIYSINDAGNLIDACCLAAVSALLSARMPKYDDKMEVIKYGELTSKPLPLTNKVPVTITFYKVGSNILIDAVREEEDSSDARLSVSLTKDKQILINALQKGEPETFTEQEVEKMIGMAIEKFKEIRKKIEKIEEKRK